MQKIKTILYANELANCVHVELIEYL